MKNCHSVLACLLCFFCALAYAHKYQKDGLMIGHPYARATVVSQPSGAVYFSIENNGKEADKLVSVSTPIARTAQIHMMSMDGNIMKMREVDSITVAVSEKVAMKPGDGYHVMLTGLQQQLKAGDKFPLTMEFEKAGKVEVSVLVE